MNDLNDPLAIARAVGVLGEEEQRRWWRVPRHLKIPTEVVILGGYCLVTVGVYIGLLIRP